MSDGGKGSRARPLGVPKEVYDKNFEAIFGKKKKEPADSKESNDTTKSNEQN
jgi:hypothetical protein